MKMDPWASKKNDEHDKMGVSIGVNESELDEHY